MTRDQLIQRAEVEVIDQGCISFDTAVALAGEGVEVERLEARLINEQENA